jgi:hypothetical protein
MINASKAAVAPNICAKIMSRKKPNSRDNRVIDMTMDTKRPNLNRTVDLFSAAIIFKSDFY